jgi:hypothetical protein
MDAATLLEYVRAASQLLELPLDETRQQAVADHLARTRVIAQMLEQAPLGVAHEPAEIFRPAPFPAEDA